MTPGGKDVAEWEEGTDEVAGIRDAEADRQQPPGAGSRARDGDARSAWNAPSRAHSTIVATTRPVSIWSPNTASEASWEASITTVRTRSQP